MTAGGFCVQIGYLEDRVHEELTFHQAVATIRCPILFGALHRLTLVVLLALLLCKRLEELLVDLQVGRLFQAGELAVSNLRS